MLRGGDHDKEPRRSPEGDSPMSLGRMTFASFAPLALLLVTACGSSTSGGGPAATAPGAGGSSSAGPGGSSNAGPGGSSNAGPGGTTGSAGTTASTGTGGMGAGGVGAGAMPPGITYWPPASTTVAPVGACRSGPTAVTLPSIQSTSALVARSALTTVPPRISKVVMMNP